MLLKGKVAIVTGSGRGIGGAIARGFASEGASVVLVSRTLEQLAEQERQIRSLYGAPVLKVVCDVSSEEQVESLAAAAIAEFGRIDILANCAGITMVAPSEELPLENWHKCLSINLDGTFLCCQKVGKHMIERGGGGKIINITSIVAHAAIPKRAAYAASKGGVMQLTQNLAVEWAKHDIQVNAISPGFIRTEIVQDLIDKGIHKPQLMEARIPAGRLGEVDDMVGPAVFLASSMSAYVTGVILKADGGWLANGYV
ncbi:SDR family NAD(P)-dependent oxidoreductase [Paenibacillus allorhizosphaerae]|uniref:2-dehydro-3-deoxy-D-gluconate 5-dehydrogenase n=1 Tax=Paenibacillus allorhizosphaerae TaxID=2849866 RepID=A0ABM8V9Y5_9BACL|nr:glucose 1-dehydrogenase [Paenibacillus allorhizosphaerae]CAG7614812.1 2-dehydro-3-deoxy-D-gluconate 5-dehydrogenase [Paenibacillus allorhizosphaerae]